MERYRLSLEGKVKVGLAAVALTLLSLMIGLVKLQVVEHSELKAQSENNQIRVMPTVPRRGLILDREGRVIVGNRPSYTVSVVASEIAPKQTIPNLAKLIRLDSTKVSARVRRNMVSRYQPSPVKRDISDTVLAIIEEQKRKFPGVICEMEQVRRYTDGLGAESFTGYVGEVSEQELGDSRSDLRLGSMIGKKGLEKYYDYLLRGREGTRYIEVSASGQLLEPFRDKEPVPAVPGADLTLAIDMDLQRACVEALDTFCCGAIVAMDPRDGGVLAMASYPGYDANIFSSVIPESLWVEISSDSSHPLLNRPLNGLYPPGSTVKAVGIGATLEEGLITARTTLEPCYGGMQFGNRFFRCWKPSGHGRVSATGALEQSCDVFMYQLGRKLGVDDLSHYYAKCGVGKVTGIDLPAEAAGLNPNSTYYDDRYGVKKWTWALALNNSIGQGELLMTPLQLTLLFCGLANNGIAYRPHLVTSIETHDGDVRRVDPQVALRLPFSPSTMEVLLEGSRLAVHGDDGTARALKNPRYTMGGKTGTAQNPHGDNHSWYVGFAPMENPEIVVCAIVENAGHGSDVAAPVVGHVIEQYMAKRLQRAKVTELAEQDDELRGDQSRGDQSRGDESP
jgi:penicillin-binding protein 2